MQTGGQTEMTNLIVAFHNFANAPKNAFPVVLHMRTSEIMQLMGGKVYTG
jgi:hypothetical protein